MLYSHPRPASIWGEAALTSFGFFWKALWAFTLGYVISSKIQVFVTRERMRRTMGDTGAKSVGLATFFGFISSSCSFAPLATAKSLFKKGAGFIPSMAFLLSSTNLVIELGNLIFIFLNRQFCHRLHLLFQHCLSCCQRCVGLFGLAEAAA